MTVVHYTKPVARAEGPTFLPGLATQVDQVRSFDGGENLDGTSVRYSVILFIVVEDLKSFKVMGSHGALFREGFHCVETDRSFRPACTLNRDETCCVKCLLKKKLKLYRPPQKIFF